jgi:hypothetical protein
VVSPSGEGPATVPIPELARAEAGAILSALGAANDSRTANAAAIVAALGSLSQRQNLETARPTDNTITTAVWHADVQGLTAARPPLWEVQDEHGVIAAATTKVVPQAVQQFGDGPALPSPQVSGVLDTLTTSDLSALELGMQRFLDQLGQAGQSLTGYRDGMELCLWIVASATAVAACAFARRQLARSQESGARNQEHELRDQGSELGQLVF